MKRSVRIVVILVVTLLLFSVAAAGVMAAQRLSGRVMQTGAYQGAQPGAGSEQRTAGVAEAGPSQYNQVTVATPPGQAVISADQARSAALAANPGTTATEVSTEYDDATGVLFYKVTLSDGREIRVNGSNGQVMSTGQEGAQAAPASEATEESGGAEQARETLEPEESAPVAPAGQAFISPSQAEAAAVAANPGTSALSAELDDENGMVVYKVSLSNGQDAQVNATNGQVLPAEQEGTEAPSNRAPDENNETAPSGGTPEPEENTNQAPAGQAVISASQAEAAAVAANPGASALSAELDTEHGTPVYKVKLSNDRDVQINAVNGQVMQSQGENSHDSGSQVDEPPKTNDEQGGQSDHN